MRIYIDYKLLYYLETDIDTNEEKRLPYTDRIEKLNGLLDKGNEIHIWLEGSTSFLHEVIASLESWGCRFGYVKLGKPEYDMIIDENCMDPKTFFKGTEE